MPDDAGRPLTSVYPQSIETRASWVAAGITLAILSLVYGSTLIIVVGLRAMEADLGVPRSVLALAGSLTWVGTGSGGIAMGWLADRIGIRNSVLIGAVMVTFANGLLVEKPIACACCPLPDPTPSAEYIGPLTAAIVAPRAPAARQKPHVSPDTTFIEMRIQHPS